ncbi:Integrase zinc binding domain [Popillia japonica]|uniref:RNA-directed DNA polymerase n=1 Tax=Popillia japonica TaxID=7064 RepID=A0AAW1JJJ0_POPJA
MNTIPEIDNDWMEEIQKASNDDLTLTKLIKKIREGWPKYLHHLEDDLKAYHKFKNELRTENGLILKGNQIVIPTKLRRNMIRKIHINRNRIEATIKLAKESLFWPGMNSQIKDIVQNCEICCKFADSQRKAPMQSHEIPIYPFKYVSLDVCYGYINQKSKRFW